MSLLITVLARVVLGYLGECHPLRIALHRLHIIRAGRLRQLSQFREQKSNSSNTEKLVFILQGK